MKIITRGVIDWDGHVLEEESFEYCGPVAACKDSGSAPAAVDPYEQAAAQYGLSTGTANYNAAINRTGVNNALGSSAWGVNGYSGGPPSGETSGTTPMSAPYGFGATGGGPSPSAPAAPTTGAGTQGNAGWGAITSPSASTPTGGVGSQFGSNVGYGLGGASNGDGYGIPNGSGAPLYSQTTTLAPWAQNLESSPIDTSQIPGMPGGPSLQQNVNSAENATYGQEMQLLAPQEAQQGEQTQSQLEAEGAMPGSPAYEYGEKMLGLTQGAENTSAANQAVTTGMGELPMFYGLGSTDLQNQLAERGAPISEFEGLQGNTGGNVSAATPDISGAFGQQLQSQLAGYNANTATNNANTGSAASLASLAALLAFA